MKNIHIKGVLAEDVAQYYYEMLRDEVDWIKVPNRKQSKLHNHSKHINTLTELGNIANPTIMKVLAKQFNNNEKMNILGCNLDLYENGEMFCPVNTHLNQTEIIIALGCSRTVIINDKKHILNNGDVMIFKSKRYEIVQEKDVKEGCLFITIFTLLE